jgi:hypothetical protein
LIIFLVGHEHFIALVVGISQFEDAGRELTGLLTCLLEGEIFGAVYILVRHGFSLGSTADESYWDLRRIPPSS